MDSGDSSLAECLCSQRRWPSLCLGCTSLSTWRKNLWFENFGCETEKCSDKKKACKNVNTSQTVLYGNSYLAHIYQTVKFIQYQNKIFRFTSHTIWEKSFKYPWFFFFLICFVKKSLIVLKKFCFKLFIIIFNCTFI